MNEIEDLQTKIAFLEDTVEDLNQSLIAQQRQIELLNKNLQLMQKEFRQVLHSDLPEIIDQKPPHY